MSNKEPKKKPIDNYMTRAGKVLSLPVPVMRVKGKPNHYMVRSASDMQVTYMVTLIPEAKFQKATCTCIDFQIRGEQNQKHKCKHIIAAIIASKSKRLKEVDSADYQLPT